MLALPIEASKFWRIFYENLNFESHLKSHQSQSNLPTHYNIPDYFLCCKLHVEWIISPQVSHLILWRLPQQANTRLRHVKGLWLDSEGLHLLDVLFVAILEVLRIKRFYTRNKPWVCICLQRSSRSINLRTSILFIATLASLLRVMLGFNPWRMF